MRDAASWKEIIAHQEQLHKESLETGKPWVSIVFGQNEHANEYVLTFQDLKTGFVLPGVVKESGFNNEISAEFEINLQNTLDSHPATMELATVSKGKIWDVYNRGSRVEIKMIGDWHGQRADNIVNDALRSVLGDAYKVLII